MTETTTLEPERYFALIDDDTERMLAVADGGLDAQVPSCPDWTVADLVEHTAYVYLHKARVMADAAFPQQWPPSTYDGIAPLDLLRTGKDELFAEFARHDVTEQTATFGADSTIGFWARRMALEAAVHRYDAELAAGAVTEVPADLGLDGIDEALRVFLASGYGDPDLARDHPVDADIAVQSAGVRWVVGLTSSLDVEVSVSPATSDDQASGTAAATVAGDPAAVFLWLWGRLGDDAVALSGDPAALAGFRARLRETQG